jgi:hypothetical protein
LSYKSTKRRPLAFGLMRTTKPSSSIVETNPQFGDPNLWNVRQDRSIYSSVYDMERHTHPVELFHPLIQST